MVTHGVMASTPSDDPGRRQWERASPAGCHGYTCGCGGGVDAVGSTLASMALASPSSLGVRVASMYSIQLIMPLLSWSSSVMMLSTEMASSSSVHSDGDPLPVASAPSPPAHAHRRETQKQGDRHQ